MLNRVEMSFQSGFFCQYPLCLLYWRLGILFYPLFPVPKQYIRQTRYFQFLVIQAKQPDSGTGFASDRCRYLIISLLIEK